MRRFRYKVRLGTDHAAAFTVLSSPLSFLGMLDIFKKLQRKGGRVSAMLPVTIMGTSRMLRLEFEQKVEPPNRVTYTGSGDARLRIAVTVKPAGGGAEAEFEVEVSAHTLVEPVAAALIHKALRSLPERFEEAAAPARPIPEPVALPPVEGVARLEVLSERLADPLILGELLLSSKYVEAFKTPANMLESRVRQASSSRGETLYIVAVVGGATLRMLAKGGEILAASYEGPGGTLKGVDALDRVKDLSDTTITVRVFTVEPGLAGRLLGGT